MLYDSLLLDINCQCLHYFKIYKILYSKLQNDKKAINISCFIYRKYCGLVAFFSNIKFLYFLSFDFFTILRCEVKRIICFYSAKRYWSWCGVKHRCARNRSKYKGARATWRASCKRFRGARPLVNIRTALLPVTYSTIHLQDTLAIA